MDEVSADFERLTDIDTAGSTLIEGLPGHGLVASIAVDQITRQLGLEHHGNVVSDAFPPVTSYNDGRVRDLVRVYAGGEGVMTLQSDIAIPPSSFEALSYCVLEDLATEYERAIFLVGAPAESEEGIGEVTAAATTESVERDLVDAGIELAEGSGIVGGITGALVNECYRCDEPAAVLIVRAHPYVPDPAAARSVIENALEPLVDFDIDTDELQQQADEIRERLQQIAQQYQQMSQEGETPVPQSPQPSMYQ